MKIPENIDSAISWDGLRQFGSFVLSHCEDGNLPDYKKMDLMKIPQLVPYIWSYDLRDNDKKKGLLLNFCGQIHNDMHGFNPMGKYDIDCFKDDLLIDKIIAFYAKSINEKKIAFSKRYKPSLNSTGEKHWKYVELIFFPCSSDGKTIDWGIGCLNFDFKPNDDDNVFLFGDYLA